jgi:TM2 domain-containing membrane protein YozV
MKKLTLLIFLTLSFTGKPAIGGENDAMAELDRFFIVATGDFQSSRPTPLLKLFKVKQQKYKKLTAAALAFPFPFGIVGLHRIYLGCAPYVPVVYIASLGGAFGLVPLIDCFVILLSKDIEQYSNSKKVFMWVD